MREASCKKAKFLRAEHTVNKPFVELARELLAGHTGECTTAVEDSVAEGKPVVSYIEDTESGAKNISASKNIDSPVDSIATTADGWHFGSAADSADIDSAAVPCVNHTDSAEVLAAVLQLHYGSVLSASHYRNIKVPRTEDKRGKSSDGNTIRLYIGLGRKDGTSKRSLAQFFSTLLSIPEHAVDRIELFDRFSLADLPADAAHEALRLSKKKANMPHIHIDTKSNPVTEKSVHSAGYAKKSPSRKLREGNRREAFFREKDTRKKHPVSAGSASAYKKRK